MMLKKGDQPSSYYDVIVIGSGLGGLTSANTLAKYGKKVLLVEAHNKLGGLATWFRRQPTHIFDVSLHGFPYGMVKTCRKYWGKEVADMIIPIQSLAFINPQYSIETSFTKEDFIKIFQEKFGIDLLTIHSFFDEVQSYDLSTPATISVGDLFQKYFPDRKDIHRFLLEPISYANGHTLEDPALSFGIVFSNFMKKGVYTVAGGTDQFINKMKEILLENGVDIKLQTKIEKIEVIKNGANKEIKGVYINDQLIESKAIISNGNLFHTINGMVGIEHFPDFFAEELKQVRPNSSSCQVYMGIKKGEKLPQLPDLIFHSTAKDFNTEDLLSLKISSRTFSIYRPEIRPELNQYAIVSSTNATYQDWEKLSKEEYENQKQIMIKETIECLEKIVPEISSKIDFVDAATPLTIESYTHHYLGSSFGTKFEGLAVGQKLPDLIKGLYHAGSIGIVMSGWLGAANYGVITANRVLNSIDNEIRS